MTEIAPHRIGRPSPLITHLGAASVGYQSLITTVENAQLSEVEWQPELSEMAKTIPNPDLLNLSQSAVSRLRELLAGLEKWQHYPYRRTIPDPAVIWSDGSSRLLDFGTCSDAVTPDGPPVLVVPSLINKSYVLDLDSSTSLMRFLSAQGLRPLLLDWGEPSDAEQVFDLNAYAEHRIIPAIKASRALSDRPIGILGYCMGGTLASGVLSKYGDDVGAFATIGSPWDFSACTGMAAVLQSLASSTDFSGKIDDIGTTFGMFPAELFQHLFALINPMQAAVKFRKFAAMSTDSASAKHFVAIEDWLADGVPLTTPAAINLLVDWNLKNVTANGNWELLGSTVNLGKIRQPTLNVCGKRDSITQLKVATAMATQIHNSKVLIPDAGHVGMIVGSSARKSVWEPVSKFFEDHLL